MKNDLQLWGELKAGNRKAFDEIYKVHADVLFRYGYKFSKDDALIEDCIHDLFIYIWKNRAGLSDTDSIKRYVLASFRNRIIKDLKKAQKTKLSDKNEMENYFDAQLSKEQSIVQKESIIENKRKIDAAFANLSPREKEAIYLKYYNQLDSESICKVMGINNQSLRNVLHSAIKKMRGKIVK